VGSSSAHRESVKRSRLLAPSLRETVSTWGAKCPQKSVAQKRPEAPPAMAMSPAGCAAAKLSTWLLGLSAIAGNMLLPPDKNEVRPQSVKAWRDINTLTPSHKVIHLYRDGDELCPFGQQHVIARIHEFAPGGERPREANVVAAGFRQTAEFVSGNGGPGQITLHGARSCWKRKSANRPRT